MKILANKNRLEQYTIDQKIEELSLEAVDFHQQLPDYNSTPLHSLPNLASNLRLASLQVKDESQRCGLKAFKVMGGAFAMGKVLKPQGRLELQKLKQISLSQSSVFATATDGNHGKGVAYFATFLGASSKIYVPKSTVPDRISAIEMVGGEVTVIEGTYDEAVAKMAVDANQNQWLLISDTSWPGYEQIPQWVMQGYYSIFQEILAQLKSGLPTHIFIQGGVGTLAAAVTNFFKSKMKDVTIIVVEPEGAACLFQSAKEGDGRPHNHVGNLSTIMAGLSCAVPNPLAWSILNNGVDYFIKCEDQLAIDGMKQYYRPLGDDPQVISGESGAATLGALLTLCQKPKYASWRHEIGLSASSEVLLINTEGDSDMANFKRLVVSQGSSREESP